MEDKYKFLINQGFQLDELKKKIGDKKCTPVPCTVEMQNYCCCILDYVIPEFKNSDMKMRNLIICSYPR